jgi:hypothetical protein
MRRWMARHRWAVIGTALGVKPTPPSELSRLVCQTALRLQTAELRLGAGFVSRALPVRAQIMSSFRLALGGPSAVGRRDSRRGLTTSGKGKYFLVGKAIGVQRMLLVL